MRTIYRYLLLVSVFAGGGLFGHEAFANNDYVCSYYQTSCSCTWDTSWGPDGTKHCIGTRQTGTRIGNTRVGCPSSASAYGTETYRNKGGYMFGDVAGATVSCDLVKYDDIAPTASANANANIGIIGYTGIIRTNTSCNMTNGPGNPSDCTAVRNGSGTITGYNGTIRTNTSCNMTNGPGNPSDCTAVTQTTGHTFQPRCADNESGCKSVPANFTLNIGASRVFTVYDLANNSALCTAYWNGTFGGCTGAVYPGNSVVPTNGVKCTFANGVSCTPDHAAPIAQISYAPASCINTDVVVTNTCIRDVDDSWNSPWSGCRWAPEDKADLNVASNQGGTLWIADGAGNVTNLSWNIDWIDKTPPHDLQFVTANQKAGTANIFGISARDDIVAAGCSGPDLNFRLDITGAATKIITGKTPRDGTSTTGNLGLTKNGVYNILVTVTDQAGNPVSTTYSNLTIYPADPDVSKSSITLVSPSKDSLYADNIYTYQYKLSLKDIYDNPIYSKTLDSIDQENNGTAGFKTVKTDMSNPSAPSGDDALIEGGTWTTSANGELNFTVKSLTPGVFSERFGISLKTWWNDYVDTSNSQSLSLSTGNENSFRKTFVWGLSVITSPFRLLLGTALTMQLGVTPKSSAAIASYGVNDFSHQIRLRDEVNQEILNKTAATNLATNPILDYRIEAKTDAWVGISPVVYIDGNPIMSYSLGGENVRYRLSATDSASDTTNISLSGDTTSSLKIAGSLQWEGKQTVTGQKYNFSDISKSDMRAIIRKNAYALIRSRTSSETSVIGGVKFIEGNYTLPLASPDYETLVVKNGNLTISANFNTLGKKFGIIVLRDDTTRSDLGNIYVKPGVRYVQAAIYADGGLISSGFKSWEDTVGNYKDSATRTNTLSSQLVINGSLFTRNTIWGAILGDSRKYILPGGSLTTDFNLAMMYDLNYLRRGNAGYNVSGSNGTKDYNQGNSDNVVIISNPNLQKDPPKGFRN